MKMNDKIVDGVGIALQSMLTFTQTDEIFRIISLVLTILSAVVVLARNIYEWYKRAKADGKIDKEEIDEVIDIVNDGIHNINDKLDQGKK